MRPVGEATGRTSSRSRWSWPNRADDGDYRQSRAPGLHQLDAAAAAGPVPARRHHGEGRDRGPPTEPGDKPVILRPDDRPKKQSTRLLKAECLECGYTIRLTKERADLGLRTCPTDGAALMLDGGRAW
jgi:hypothetical protein